MTISGVSNYQTFGLKPEFISELIATREDFKQKASLGKNMIQSAPYWFRESYLIEEGTAIRPTKLLSIAEKLGVNNPQLWLLLWQGLVNRSSLVKWFVCRTYVGTAVSIDELQTQLADSVASAATRKGVMSSLNQLLKMSPLGEADASCPVAALETKGRTVQSITRLSVHPDPLVVLYGLYLMQHLVKRSTFTIREMMTAEFDSPFVSPLYAFGIPPDEFKKICSGLATKYPDFLQVNFTLGLDEVRTTADKTLDDVLEKIEC